MTQHSDFDLDVDAPEKLPHVLRHAAMRFAESKSELESAWQEKNGATAIWGDFARILERAADQAEKAMRKRGFRDI